MGNFLVRYDPRKRITAAQALEHEYDLSSQPFSDPSSCVLFWDYYNVGISDVIYFSSSVQLSSESLQVVWNVVI